MIFEFHDYCVFIYCDTYAYCILYIEYVHHLNCIKHSIFVDVVYMITYVRNVHCA